MTNFPGCTAAQNHEVKAAMYQWVADGTNREEARQWAVDVINRHNTGNRHPFDGVNQITGYNVRNSSNFPDANSNGYIDAYKTAIDMIDRGASNQEFRISLGKNYQTHRLSMRRNAQSIQE